MRQLKPNFTQIPNVLLDWWIANLPRSEFLCLLYICRRTYGFQREADNISIDQFVHGIKRDDGVVLDAGTGLSRRAVVDALAALTEKGLIVKISRHKANGADAPSTFALTMKLTQVPLGESATIAPYEGATIAPYEGAAIAPTKERKESNTPLTPQGGNDREEEEDALRAEDRDEAALFPEMDGDRWFETKAVIACRGFSSGRVRAGKLSDGQRMFLRRVLDSENQDWAQRRLDVLDAMRDGYSRGWDVTRSAMAMVAEIDHDGPQPTGSPAQEEERPEPRKRRGGGAKSAPAKKRSKSQDKEDAYQEAMREFLASED